MRRPPRSTPDRSAVAPLLVCLALGAGIAACGDEPSAPPPPVDQGVTAGNISVVLERSGEGDDADGVTVSLWAGSLLAAKPARLGDSISFGKLSAGTYTVSVTGLDPLCRGESADVIRVEAQDNVLRLASECAGRFLYEKTFSDTRVILYYVGPDSRLRTLSLAGRHHVRDMSPDGETALVEQWNREACGVRVRAGLAPLEGGLVLLEQNVRRPVTEGAVWSPRGDLVAAREGGVASCGDSDDKAIVLFDAKTGRAAHLVADGAARALGPSLAWSPDGSRLAYVSANLILAYDVDVGTLLQLHAAATASRPVDLSWSPNGRFLLFRPDPAADYRILDLSDGSTRSVPVPGAARGAWHPTGNLLALEGSGPEGVFVVNVGDGSVTPATATPVSQAGHPSWNAAGDRLLLTGARASGARAVFVVDWPGRTVWPVLEGDASGPERARWTRGRHVP